MSWLDRLGESIIMVSPEGREFEARWKGSDRSKAKKLGAFSPPRKTGTVFQDLDIAASSYPMTIHFDGINHDVIANLFYVTCDEKGVWKVTHPVHGLLDLQLVSITQKDQPITNGNLTEFDLEWVEPLKDDSLVSSAKLAEDIQAQLNQLNLAANDQLESVAKQDSSFTIQSLKNTIESVTTAITEFTRPLSELNTDISRIVNEIQRGINAILLNPLIPITSVASQIQQLTQLPSLATQSIQTRLDSYNNLINTVNGITPSEISSAGRNESAVKELTQVAVLATLPQIVSTGPVETRAQALEFAEFLQQSFETITDALDADQELFMNETIDVQYFSQSGSYTDTAKMIALGIEYLLRASFDLKVEKRFKLKKDRSPIEITISEYGTLGENDQNFDLFIASNNLKGDDILLLPAGREVVVYV